MAREAIEANILEALERVAPDHGIDIVSVEMAGPGDRPTVRVRVDRLDGEPIDMGEVVRQTSWVSQVVEDLDPFTGAYDLEVSSPGIDRPLRRERDFARFVGEDAEVAVRQQVDGRNKLSGEIIGAQDGVVSLLVDGKELSVELANVKAAKIKPDFDAIFAAAKAAKLDDAPDFEDDDEQDGQQ